MATEAEVVQPSMPQNPTLLFIFKTNGTLFPVVGVRRNHKSTRREYYNASAFLAKPLTAVVLIICHAESSINPSGNSLFSFLTFLHSPAKAEASVMCGDDDDKKHDFVSNDNQ